MPWKLISFILIFAIFLLFIMFNLENKCDINFGFKTLSDVPVFLTVFFSFAAGFAATLPMVFRAGIKRTNTPPQNKKPEPKPDKKFTGTNNSDKTKPADGDTNEK